MTATRSGADAEARARALTGDAARAGAELEAVFAEVASTLEAGDLEASARASLRLTAACQAAAGIKLDPACVARLQALLARCNARAGEVQTALEVSLANVAQGNRATRAYRDR